MTNILSCVTTNRSKLFMAIEHHEKLRLNFCVVCDVTHCSGICLCSMVGMHLPRWIMLNCYIIDPMENCIYTVDTDLNLNWHHRRYPNGINSYSFKDVCFMIYPLNLLNKGYIFVTCFKLRTHCPYSQYLRVYKHYNSAIIASGPQMTRGWVLFLT